MSALLIVAHPDDETIFFGGTLQALAHMNWEVICVTDGNGDGRGSERKEEFQRACKALGVARATQFSFADVPDARLPLPEVEKALREYAGNRKFEKVLTHGPIGEYGHSHHQDVSVVVHKVFSEHTPTFSCAYNVFPDWQVALTQEHFNVKAQIFWEIYRKEISRFLNILPNTFSEGHAQIKYSEVQTIYECLAHQTKIAREKLTKYKWLADYLDAGLLQRSLKQFLSSYLEEQTQSKLPS